MGYRRLQMPPHALGRIRSARSDGHDVFVRDMDGRRHAGWYVLTLREAWEISAFR